MSFEIQETESKSYKWKLRLSQHWVTCSFLCLYVFAKLSFSPILTSNLPSPFLLLFMSSVLQPSFNIPNSILLPLLEKFSIFSGMTPHLSLFYKMYLNFASQFSQDFRVHPCWTNFLPFANAALWLWAVYPQWPTSSSYQNHAQGVRDCNL